jgi:hypothetical protein
MGSSRTPDFDHDLRPPGALVVGRGEGLGRRCYPTAVDRTDPGHSARRTQRSRRLGQASTRTTGPI